MEREARLLERAVMVEGVDWITAMERLADTHPSRTFADLLRGYANLVVTGGEISSGTWKTGLGSSSSGSASASSSSRIVL